MALYLHGEAEFLLKAAHTSSDTSMQRRAPSRVEQTDRLRVLQALLGVLEQLGVDGLFAAHVYEEAARRGGDCAPRWVRLMGCGDALDLRGLTRPTAKAALAHVLERDFVASAGTGTFRAIAMMIIADGEPVLKEEVQRFLALLDLPLHAVTQPHDAGLLVVPWDQLWAYVEAQRQRRHQTTTGPA